MRGRLLWLAASLAVTGTAGAAQGLALLMFETPDCSYCLRWEREVGVVYQRTSEGRVAPLTRVPLAGPLPAGTSLEADVRYSPTFVLLRDGREVGRITGYPGEDHFWGLLGALLAAQTRTGGGHIQP